MIVVLVPAVALALLTLAAFFGGTVWWLDVLANFRAQYFVILATLGVVIAVSRWRRWGYGVLAVALLNLILVMPLFIGSPANPEPGAPTLRVMSFNLLSTNEAYSGVVEYIEAIDPDVVLLHEASRPWEVALEAADLGYEIVRPRSDDLIFGTLVLVRGAAVQAVSYGYSTASPRAVSVAFTPEGWDGEVTVLGTHPLAPTDRERASLRDAQLEFARDWAEGRSGPFVIAGDMNATPWSHPFRSLVSLPNIHNSQIGYGLQPSFPTTSNVLLRVPIDHLLYSDGLEVIDRRLGPPLESDHFPLIVDLQASN